MIYYKRINNPGKVHCSLTDRGNVLFLILLAVILFAALSYAITQSTRGGGDTDKETLKLKASEIVNYALNLKVATDRLALVNGCSLSELSFQADWDKNGTDDGGHPNDQANTITPSDGKCRYFHSNGGGVSPRHSDSFIEASRFIRNMRLHGEMIVQGLGSDSLPELVFAFRLYPTGENLALCNAYNEFFGLPPNLSDPFHAQFLTYFSWTGSFGTTVNPATIIGDSDTNLIGQTAACFNAVGYDDGGYLFYYVLAER